MRDTMLQGLGRHLVPIPHFVWQEHVAKSGHDTKAGLGFMSEEHHLVRNYAVRELVRVGKPLSPEFIAQNLGLPVARTIVILDDLEKHLTFLFRNEQGAVTWAYPVTLDRTPHHLTFSTGEQIYAA